MPKKIHRSPSIVRYLLSIAPCSLPLLFLFFAQVITAQNVHFSQMYNNPLRMNPARAGVFNGHIRGAALYRQQWSAVPVPYQTLSAGVDWKGRQKGKNGLAFAALLEHDKAGDGGLRWTKMGGLLCVHHQIGVNLSLSAGFGTEFAQRNINIEALTFQKQWNGDVFDANLSNGENMNRTSGVFPLLSGGINLHYASQETRSSLNVGFGTFHLNRPNVGFRQDDPDHLPIRWALLTDGFIQLREQTDLLYFGTGQLMARASEWVAGGGIRQILAAQPGHYLDVQMSIGLRWKDAVIPALQITWNDWTVGLSYDVNTSPFQIATARRGGPEVALVWRPIPVPNVKTTKCCPIF
jgi:type IX secretion system PorP/SprF family membrane protein